jgi:nucleoside-diphosphate-sugar epimerase
MRLGLKGKKIFLTGASGFIGARLAECLIMAYGAEVHALVRRVGTVGAARLARLPKIKMFQGDVRDLDSVKKAAAGCSHFVHCVTGTPGSYWHRKKEEVVGTRNILEIAAHQGAERMVYFSSAAVHDPARSGDVIREESPLNGKFPTSMKIPSEVLVSEYRHRYSLPTVVLRPTCVWGPFSPTWTTLAVELIRKGIPFLPLEGGGTAKAVDIDNLVDAVYLALTKRESVGHAFLINDDEPKTWGELYGGYAHFLGIPLPFISESGKARDLLWVSLYNARRILQNTIVGTKRRGMRTVRELYDHVPAVKVLVSMLPGPLKQRLRMYATDRERTLEVSSPPKDPAPDFLPYPYISRHIRELYGSKSSYSNEKAKRVLGWSPRVSFQEALDRTCQWFHYAGYKE